MDIIVSDDVPMTIVSVDLSEKASTFGSIRLIRAEWWAETPHFVLLRYGLDGKEQDDYLRLDLDKSAFIDDSEDGLLRDTLQRKTPEIWALVVAEQQKLADQKRA